MTLTVYRDSRGEWRWRVQAPNGRIVADSAEGYEDRSDCVDMALAVVREGVKIEVDE